MFSRGSSSEGSSTTKNASVPASGRQADRPATTRASEVPPATEPAAPRPQTAPPRVSTIGPDLKIVGSLVCSGELHIEGRVEGDIESRIISVKPGAQIDGALIAESITVGGAVIGQVRAPTVTVAGTARLLGDVLHHTLAVEAGAHLEGHCRQLDASSTAKSGGLKAAANRNRG